MEITAAGTGIAVSLYMTRRRPGGDRNPVLYMMLASVGVVLAFLVSTYYWYDVGARIAAAASAAAIDSALSVKHLSEARGEDARLQALARAAVDAQARKRPVDTRALIQSLAALRVDLNAYLALPLFPGEQSIQTETFATARRFEATLAQLVSRVERGDQAGARKALEDSVLPTGERLNDGLDRLILFNAEQQYWWAHTLEEQRRHAGRMLYAFNGVTLLLALLLLLLTVRVTRIQWRLIEERERGAQERALENARFSERLERLSSASVLVWQATTSTSDPVAMLRSVVEQARELTGADYAAVGVGGDDEHPFDPWVFSGIGSAEAQAIGRTPRPVGVLGAVVRRKETLRIVDLNKSPHACGLPPGHPPMGPFLGVPIVEADRSIGHLYLARRPGREPFDDQDERIVRLLSSFVETAFINVQLNREVQTAIQQREEMISIISHDLKSPLNAVALCADRIQMLCAGSDNADEFRTVGERIARTVDRMDRLIGNLVDLSLVESSALPIKRVPQAVEPMVAEAVELLTPLARERSIELVAAVEPVPAVLCDSDRIIRVLWNLISNSVKFTEPGGKVTVSARSLESEVYLVVQDTGIGIAEEQLRHVFDRFWRAEPSRRGTGLGLYICRGIVEAHGGKIGVKSQRGVGTSIWFTLPAQSPLATQPQTILR
jgi:signal transduction histidine kinase